MGLANGFTFSTKGTIANPNGTDAIDIIPRTLFGNALSNSNVGNKNHSGKISNGVSNGSADSPISVGQITAPAILNPNTATIQTGNMYNKSLGQAISPYELCPKPLDSFALSIGSRTSGFTNIYPLVCSGGNVKSLPAGVGVYGTVLQECPGLSSSPVVPGR